MTPGHLKAVKSEVQLTLPRSFGEYLKTTVDMLCFTMSSSLSLTILSAMLAIDHALARDPCGPSNQPPQYTWNSCSDMVKKSSSNEPSPYEIFSDSDPLFSFPESCADTNQLVISQYPDQNPTDPYHPFPEVDALCAGMVSQNVTDVWVFARYIDQTSAVGEVGLYIPGSAGAGPAGARPAGARPALVEPTGARPMMSYEQCQKNLFQVVGVVGTKNTNRASVNLVRGGFPTASFGTNKTGQPVDPWYPSYLARA